MKFLSYFIFSAFVLSVSCAPSEARAQTITTTDRAALLELIVSLQAQIESLQNQLQYTQRQQSPGQPARKAGTAFEETSEIVAKYYIDSSNDVSRITNRLHRGYLQRVLEIMPNEFDTKITQFVVFKGSYVPFDAYVETIAPKHAQWQYAVHQDILTLPTAPENTELIIHELAHLVSYEEIIGVPKPAFYVCNDYFNIVGCPEKNSYLHAFTDQFWSDDDLDRALGLIESYDADVLYRYYLRNSDSFVSDYAALSPEEDFSESFVYFILDRSVQGETLEQKINFFESYPELLEMKQEILLSL